MRTYQPTECFICKGRNCRIVFSYDHPDQYEKTVGIDEERYIRKWVQCKHCGLYYSIYSRDAAVLDSIYTSYRSEDVPWRKESPQETFNKVINLPPEKSETAFRVSWIKNHLQRMWEDKLFRRGDSLRLLDIGGGTGIFAYAFQDEMWKSYVIDPSADASFFKDKLGIPLIKDYYRPGTFGHPFDLISLVYLLEHVRNPDTLLKSIQGDLGRSSLVYIEVPDALCFKFKPAEDDIFNSCHLWMFNPTTLSTLLDSCGFEILALDRVKTARGHFALMVLAGKKMTAW